MKKVLIIAYAFPPHQAIGSQRPFGLAKYFPQYGWEPVILTVDRQGESPKGIKIIKAEHKNIFSSVKSKISDHSGQNLITNTKAVAQETSNSQKSESKLYRFIKEVIYFPDPQRGWYKTAVKSASEYLDREKVDAIISTSSPETDHLIAKKLKQKYRIPWIADFRDPWTQNTYRNKFAIINYLERKLELKTLSEADAIVTVTEPWINLFASLHRGKKIYCITNGYDDDKFIGNELKLTDKFTITYAGSLYEGKRDPSLLFEVLEQLIKEKKIDKNMIEVRFYGSNDKIFMEKIKKSNLEGIVNFYGRIPREEVLIKLRESQALLLLVWDSKDEEGFCPAKIYEYFGAKRPIIATGWPGSVVNKMIENINAGKFTKDKASLKNVLLNYYKEFIDYGEVRFRGNSIIENYKYKSITKKYSEVLNTLVKQ